MAAARLLLLPAAPISPVQGGLLSHGGEEGDAEMAVKGQIDDDIPGRVDVTDLSADVLDHRSGCPSTGWTDAQCFSRWFLPTAAPRFCHGAAQPPENRCPV